MTCTALPVSDHVSVDASVGPNLGGPALGQHIKGTAGLACPRGLSTGVTAGTYSLSDL